MKKEKLLQILGYQIDNTKKTTRRDIISMVRGLVAHHIKDGANIDGVNVTRDGTGLNLGEVVEVILHSVFRNALRKTEGKGYDLQIKGEKVEVKFTTSDAYAHPINPNAQVDYYLIVAYSKKLGGMVFKVPYEQRMFIETNEQNRITINQRARFFDSELTKRVFAC